MNTSFNITQGRITGDSVLPIVSTAAYVGAGLIAAKHAFPAALAAILHVTAAFTEKLHYKSQTTARLRSIEARCIKEAKVNLKRDTAIATSLTAIGFTTGLLKAFIDSGRKQAEAAAEKLAREKAKDTDSVISNLYDIHLFRAVNRAYSIVSNYFSANPSNESLLDCGPKCWEKVERVNSKLINLGTDYVVEPMQTTASKIYAVPKFLFTLVWNVGADTYSCRTQGHCDFTTVKSTASSGWNDAKTSLSSGWKAVTSKTSEVWKWAASSSPKDALNAVTKDPDKTATITSLGTISSLTTLFTMYKAGLGPKRMLKGTFWASIAYGIWNDIDMPKQLEAMSKSFSIYRV